MSHYRVPGTSRAVVVLAFAGLVLAGTAVPAHAATGPVSEDRGNVPVLGQRIANSNGVNDEGNPPMVLTLHGVRRFDGGVAVYYSATGARPDGKRTLTELGKWSPVPNVCGGPLAGAALIDPATRSVSHAMPDPDDQHVCLASSVYGTRLMDDGTKEARAGVVVVAPVPAGTQTVDVVIQGVMFPQVKIEDGLLPSSMTDDTLPVLGQDWPRVNQEKAKRAAAKADAYRSTVTFPVVDLATKNATTVGTATTTVEMRADILFAFDKSDLTPEASAAIDAAAKQIKDKGITGGIVKVLGYTDSQGSDSRNQELSKARAEAVAAQLRTRVPGVTFAPEGKGAAEPIADNASDEGRARNRRVEIVLPKGN